MLGFRRITYKEIIAASGAYESKEGCQKGIASVKENSAKVVIKDYTT